MEHAEKHGEKFRKVPWGALRSLRQYTKEGFQRAGYTPPSHVKAGTSGVFEVPSSRGGFNVAAEEAFDRSMDGMDAFLQHLRTGRKAPPRESEGDVLTRAILREVDRRRTSDLMSDLNWVHHVESVLRLYREFHEAEHFDHRVTCLPERGFKLRTVTAPSASLAAAGELARQALFPAVADDPRLEVLVEGNPLAGVTGYKCTPGDKILSADLTAATDGFSHEVIVAVGLGMIDAGIPELMARVFVESLGAGTKTHFFHYRISELLPKALSPFELNAFKSRLHDLGWDGESKTLRIPVKRGSPMGTPCSFTLLCIVNGWATRDAKFGRICGDDFLGIFDRNDYSLYRQRVDAIGSSLHPIKSFVSRFAGTFCERFVTVDRLDGAPGGALGSGLRASDEPTLRGVAVVPVKLITVPARGTYGALSAPSGLPVFSSLSEWGEAHQPYARELKWAWSRTRRVFRCLWRDVRAVGAKKGRFPSFPLILGGLGHPSRGLREIPGSHRKLIWDLVMTEDVSVWRTFLRALFDPPRPVRSSKIALDASRSTIEGQVLAHLHCGGNFVRLIDVVSYEAAAVNTHFSFHYRGKWEPQSDRRRVSSITKLRWPRIPTPGNFSPKTPWLEVQRCAWRILDSAIEVDDVMQSKVRTVEPSELYSVFSYEKARWSRWV